MNTRSIAGVQDRGNLSAALRRLRWSGVTLRPAVPAAAVRSRAQRVRATRRRVASGRTTRRRGPLAILGLVLVFALGGCTIPGLPAASAASESGSADGAEATAGSGQDWFWYRQGTAVPSASTPVVRPASSTAVATGPAPTTEPAASTDPRCGTRLDVLTRKLVATGGSGSGTLTWQHVDDPRVVEYRVAAVAQEHPGGDDLPAQPWVTVARPTGGCQTMTTTVTGLVSGRHYVFWLDAVITNGVVTKEPMVGRSNAILVE